MSNSSHTASTTTTTLEHHKHIHRIFAERVYILQEQYHLNWYKHLGVPPAFLQLKQHNFLELAERIRYSQNNQSKHRSTAEQIAFRNKWLVQFTAYGKQSRTSDICVGLATTPHLHERKVNANLDKEGLAPKMPLSRVSDIKSNKKERRILVDAANGALTKHFRAKHCAGVSDIVNGTNTVEQCLIEYNNGVSFLPRGSINPSARQSITEFGARKLCRQLTLLNQSVIIHSPDIEQDLQTVQSLAAATRCTAVVMKFDTPFENIRELHTRLKSHNAQINFLAVGSRMPRKARSPQDLWPYTFPGISAQTTPL